MDWNILLQALGGGITGGVDTFQQMRELQRRIQGDQDERNYRGAQINERAQGRQDAQIENARKSSMDMQKGVRQGTAMKAFLGSSPEGSKLLSNMEAGGSQVQDFGSIPFSSIDEMLRQMRPPVAKPVTKSIHYETGADGTRYQRDENDPESQWSTLPFKVHVAKESAGSGTAELNRQDRKVGQLYNVAKDERDEAGKKITGFQDILKDPSMFRGSGEKRKWAGSPSDTAGYGDAQAKFKSAEGDFGIAKRAMFGDQSAVDELLHPSAGGAEHMPSATNKPSPANPMMMKQPSGEGHMPQGITIGGRDIETMKREEQLELAKKDARTMRAAGMKPDRIAYELSRKYRKAFSDPE